MRKKIVYLLILACGMSVFSAARYNGRGCDKKVTTYKASETVLDRRVTAGEKCSFGADSRAHSSIQTKKAAKDTQIGFDLLLQRFL